MTLISPVPLPAPTLSNITPFTYRDGWTYLEVLESLRVYIVQTLVPEVQDGALALIEQVNIALEAQNEFNEQEIQALIDWVNTNVPLIMDGEIQNPASPTRVTMDATFASQEVEDIVLTGRLSEANTAHLTSTALDAAYANQATEDIVASGRLSATSLNAAYAAKSIEATVSTHTTQIANNTTAINNLAAFNSYAQVFSYLYQTAVTPATGKVYVNAWSMSAASIQINETSNEGSILSFALLDNATTKEIRILASGKTFRASITGPSVDNGVYRTIPITPLQVVGTIPGDTAPVSVAVIVTI